MEGREALNEGREEGKSTEGGLARFLLIAALLVGAVVPFNGAIAVLGGSARDGVSLAVRWFALFILYWLPLGICMYLVRLRMVWRILAAYAVSVPLYALTLWVVYPAAGGEFHPFQTGLWPIYFSATPTFFLLVLLLYWICRKRWWLRTGATWIGVVAGLCGVLAPVIVRARTDAYRWPKADSGRLAIVNAHIVDLSQGAAGARVVDGEAVLVQSGKIAGVIPAQHVGADWPRHDAQGEYLLPGLIDVHVHLAAPVQSTLEPFDYGYMVKCLFSDYAPHRRDYLENGVTAIRDDGGPADSLFAMRAAIAKHRLLGPRLFAVGRLVTAPHGHPVATIWKPFPALIREGAILADDRKSLLQGLDMNYQEGPPDAVKFIYGTIGRAPERLSPELLREGIAWASEHKLISVVHAETTEEVREAIADGATGVEHVASIGTLPQDLLDLIREKRPFLDPTFGEFNTAEALRNVDEKKRESEMELKYGFVREMYQAGGVIVIGTDAPLVAYGTGLQDELKDFAEAGFGNAEILTFATLNNAAYLGASNYLGKIEEGYAADMILVRENPLQDLDTLRSPTMVMRDGDIVVWR
jgi:imidazolonepropionase-like amidohydrolase